MMSTVEHKTQKHYTRDEHKRAIYLYLNSSKKTPLEIHKHFKEEGTNISKDVIRKWIQRYRTTGQITNKKRGGNKRKNTTTDEIKQKIIKLQIENNQDTLQQIQDKLSEPKPSLSTISRTLKKAEITTKQLYTHVDEKNSDVTKAKRIEFMENTQDYLSESNVIFIDETPWNLGMKRKRGRSLKGIKAIKKSRVLKSNNISLIASISPAHGLIHYETHETTKKQRGVNASRFDTFVSNLCDTPILKTHSFFLIVDNSKVHNRDEIEHILSRKSTKTRQHHLIYLPPYSPTLTPIENIFYIWKQRAKQARINDKQQLYRYIYEDSTLITPKLCHDCYEHTLSYCPLIIDGADII